MAIEARDVHPGGWIDIPGRGTGRIKELATTPGCTQYQVTLESGWTFVVEWDESVRFWPD